MEVHPDLHIHGTFADKRAVRFSSPSNRYFHVSIHTGRGWTHATLDEQGAIDLRDYLNTIYPPTA